VVVPKRRVFIDVTPLRQSRDLRVLLGGQLVSLLGTQLTAVAVPYQVYRLTHSSLDVGLVSLAQLVPLLLCSLYGGTVIDATDRRKLLIRVEILMGLSSAGLALNADLGPRIWPLLVLPAVTAGLTAFDNPTRSSIVPNLVTPEHIAAIQIGVVQGGPRLGDLEAGAVGNAFGNEVSVVSGGLACIAGALLLSRLLPGFRTVEVGPGAVPIDPEPADPEPADPKPADADFTEADLTEAAPSATPPAGPPHQTAARSPGEPGQ
jgi:MFS family permease